MIYVVKNKTLKHLNTNLYGLS